ncbi:hypothetical protein [Pseudoflavonifractor phocaeensis]|uniref:hypothetical protein n=1 Tax=Pseudoflavonifractor phocaeensis TaxID=1870988 RepID=UPI00195794CD|nr:hypothetical protein [Pseudoflavonifractor phocaeensis]MBM6870418.1 hypothetical protein [Pseudoflavonifractor phocaeensis]
MELVEETVLLAKTMGQVEETAHLTILARAACAQLAGRLRAGVTPDYCRTAFCTAAAWLTLAGLEGGQTVRRFSAGDLTVETDGQDRQTFWRMAQDLMRPYLRDDGFAFRGVMG